MTNRHEAMGESSGREHLLELVQKEQSVSMMRRQLHRRIEFLRGTGLFDPGAPETLAQLEEQERELSARRRRLHVEIDRLRSELGPSPDQPPFA